MKLKEKRYGYDFIVFPTPRGGDEIYVWLFCNCWMC